MPSASRDRCRLATLLLTTCAVVLPQSSAAEPTRPQCYDVVIEIALPHLEENLRYATTREQLRLSEKQLRSVFPLLQSPALSGCRLDNENRSDTTVAYDLVCELGSATRGTAIWQLGDQVLRGTLSVKLGGKNMTVYQRITARLRDSCEPIEDPRHGNSGG